MTQHFIKLLAFLACLSAGHLHAEVVHDDFIIITPHKTGTHLLTAALENLLEKRWKWIDGFNVPSEKLIAILDKAKKDNLIIFMHLAPRKHIIETLRQKNYKVLFMWRDPRDQAVSLLHYIHSNNFVIGPIGKQTPFGKLNSDAQLEEIISGKRYGFSCTQKIMGNRVAWMMQEPDFVYTTYFERLVGEQGGGSRELQLIELNNIAKHIHIALTPEQIEERSRDIFGKGTTFRSGQIGGWKKHFKPQHIKAMKKAFGPVLILTGYEKNLDW